MSESQPWDGEPEIETDDGSSSPPEVDEMGLAGGMLMVAGILSIIILMWAIIAALWTIGSIPNAVLFIFGLWLMAGTAVRIAEVYGA